MSANNEDRTAKTVAGSLLGRYILKPLADWRARQRAMDELKSFDDRMLKDIGISRCEIPGIGDGTVVPRRAANENLGQQSRIMWHK